MANLEANSQPFNTLIGLLNAFLELCGLPGIPTVASVGVDASAALVPLQDTILVLTTIRAALPI
jgi:hypothetical protein